MHSERGRQIERLREAPLDVLVLGGGINGAGFIRDLALRARFRNSPLRVGLLEQNHFASGTSGKNSQLIHGGLRYLKYLQIDLVRESLRERSILLRIAPRFVHPQSFLLPMYGIKSRALYGAGLWLYDLMAGADRIAARQSIGRTEVAALEPGLTQSRLSAAAIFYDGAIPSARFVVENVLDAIANGAIAANYVRASGWRTGSSGRWQVDCEDMLTGERFSVEARKLVDARGAWEDGSSLRLVRGSHIIIPRVNASDHAIAHFEPDGRIIFLIPWGSQRQLTLVGTTDVDHSGGPDHVHISSDETAYLARIVRKLFPDRREVEPISSFSSLRPLVRVRAASATSTSRGHKIWNSADGILHIAGGKYTTYRLMAEQAADQVCREVAPDLARVHRTAETPFPEVPRAAGDCMEQRLSDYLFVTTYLGYERPWDAESLRPVAEELGAKLGWDEPRVTQEVSGTLGANSA